jgi:hypothetical protein
MPGIGNSTQRGIVSLGLIGVDTDVGMNDITVFSFDVIGEKFFDFLPITVRFKGLTAGPNLVKDNRVAGSLGVGVVDMPRDSVLNTSILTMCIWLKRLQSPKHGFLATRLRLEVGDAIEFSRHLNSPFSW